MAFLAYNDGDKETCWSRPQSKQ